MTLSSRLLLCASVASIVVTLPAHALSLDTATVNTAAATVDITIAAGDLGDALNRFARAANVTLSFTPEQVQGLKTAGLSGAHTVQSGLQQLLRGTGLAVASQGSGYVLVKQPQDAAVTLPSVKITADQQSATGPVDGYIAKRSATGTKTNTPLKEIPQSISIVTAQRIEAIGATRLRDALAYTPGINIMGWNDDSRFEWLNIRGFGAYTPGFYLDGLLLRNNNTWGVWRTENYAAERVEVLRGPASVLFGQNSPGGMVNVISKLPQAQAQRELQLQVGSNERHQLAADFTGPIDSEGQWLYRVTGVVRDAELAAQGMRDDRTFLAPSLTWLLSADTSLTLYSQLMRDRAGVFQSGGPYEGTLTANPNGRISQPGYYGEPDFDHFDQDQWLVGYALDHKINDQWRFREQARYGRLKVDYAQVMAGGFDTVNENDPNDPANFRLMGRSVFGSAEKATAFNIDNQLETHFATAGWQHTMLIGLDYQRTAFDQSTFDDYGPAPIDAYEPVFGEDVAIPAPYVDADIRLVQTGVYFQDQIKFDERWVATLGGRYDHASIDNEDNLSGNDTDQNDEELTWRAGLVYLAANGLAPYLSYSESFTPTTTINPATRKPFDPQTGKQYEAGLRYQPVDSNASYSAAVFDLRRQNFITVGADNTLMQTGEITVQGLELEAIVQPLPQLNLTAAYTWTPKADVTKSSRVSEIDKQATPVAEHQLSLWGDYRFATGIKVGLGSRYNGATDGSYETAPTEVPSYTLVDALLGYDIERWSFALNARNLTDKRYLVTCGYGVCGFGEERRLMGTATYRW